MKKAPYEQLEGESSRAFEAFRIYRDLGPARSTGKVQEKTGKNLRLLERWSSEHSWVERARAFDQHMDKKAIQEMELQHKEIKMLETEVIYTAFKKIKKGIDAMNPEGMTPNELAKWIETAVKLGRLIHGESTEISEVNHTGEVKAKHEYDIFQRVDQYKEVYKKIAERGRISSVDERDSDNE
ncbi:hypothetical protein V7659_18710 [Neobacillus drentensis]|uniref:hypothetical protein n=1 Tax=Neobacillus drentensis TaxID=220684 RepID=UPI002FFDBE94